MKLQRYANLQYVFACLSTHSKWIKAAIKDLKVIHRFFNLTLKDKEILKVFLSNYGKKMLTTSLIMEEKRWREVLLMFKFVTKVINEKELYYYWKKYLALFDLTDHIPVTPIVESVKFLDYLSKKCNQNTLVNMTIRYELLKNSSLSYEFSTDHCDNNVKLEDIFNKLENYNVKLNPSLFMEKFNIPLSKIIKNLQYALSSDIAHLSVMNHSENLIFYKNRYTGLVKIISLEDEWYALLLNIPLVDNLSFLLGADKKNYIQFIRAMQDHDVISIVPKDMEI